MIKLILKLLRLLRPLFTRLGIDFEQMTAIVAVKLTMDNRIERNGDSKKETNHTLRKQVILMFIIGICFSSILFMAKSLSMGLLIFYAYISITVITSFMTEYSRLLFSSNDNDILERFPVGSRTVLCARIISMLSYLYLITLSLSLFPYLILIFKEGFVEAQLFLMGVVFDTLFSLLLANLFYIGLMRFVSAEKFQKITAYMQTVLVMLVAVGYQFLSRFSKVEIDFAVHPPQWLYFTPPGYFMSFVEVYRQPGLHTVSLAILGIVLTGILFFVTIVCFSGSYVRTASAIDKISSGKKNKGKEKIALFLSRLCCRNNLQQAGFMLTWRMTHDNLKFKQSILPMIIFAIIFNGMPMYKIWQHTEIVSPNTILFPLYMLLLICSIVIQNLNYSEQSNLLWIYQSHPQERAGNLLLGSLNAVCLKYFMPLFVVIYVIYGILTNSSLWDDLLLCFSFSTLFIFLQYRFSDMVFPFSKERSTQQSGGTMLKLFGMMLLIFVIGGCHLLLLQIPFGVIIAIPLCWIAVYFVSIQIASIPETKIESHY